MHIAKKIGTALSGLGAGIVNGIFGAGGGMVLVPLLSGISDFEEDEIFPASVSIILPICVISLVIYTKGSGFSFSSAVPYLTGSAIGGILAGIFGKKIPTKWLHKLLGLFIIWGGFRYLC